MGIILSTPGTVPPSASLRGRLLRRSTSLRRGCQGHCRQDPVRQKGAWPAWTLAFAAAECRKNSIRKTQQLDTEFPHSAANFNICRAPSFLWCFSRSDRGHCPRRARQGQGPAGTVRGLCSRAGVALFRSNGTRPGRPVSGTGSVPARLQPLRPEFPDRIRRRTRPDGF